MGQNWQPVPLIPGASADDCKPWAAMDLCGWIPERAEIPGGRSDLCAKTLPGLQEFAAFPDCARQRGARNVEGKLFVVFDTTLGEVLTDGSIAIRGTIPGRSRVSMTHNGVNELLIVTGSAGYIYDTSAETLTQITDEGFPGAILADYIGSLFVAIEPLGRYFFNSALNDGASYNALETYQGETKPDRIVSLIAANGEVIVFSQRSIEHFAYTGEVNALFQNKGISKDRGAASTHAVALLDQAVWFLADDGGFYELRGYELRRVSTHAIEQAWSRCQLSRAFCQTWEDRGHKVVYITFPDGGTWGFDVATRLWHRRESEGMARWRPAWLQKWNGAWYAGEYNSGRVFRLDWDYHLEGADRLIRSCTTGVLHAGQKRMRLDALEVVLDAAGEATTASSVLPLAFVPDQIVVEGLTLGGGLPDGAVGDVVNFRYATSGGQSPITFAVTSGTLPAGLALDAATGALTGTYTTAASDNAWTVTATDANGDTAVLVEAQYVFGIAGNLANITTGTLVPDFLQDFTDDLTDFSVYAGSSASFTIVTDTYGKCLQVAPGANAVDAMVQTITAGRFSEARLKFKVTAVDADDYGAVDFRDASNNIVFGFTAGRESATDALRRPNAYFADQAGQPGNPMGAGSVTLDTWYQFEALYDTEAGTFDCSVTRLSDGVVFGSVSVTVTDRTQISQIVIRTDDLNGSGTVRWDDIEIVYANDESIVSYQYTESGGVDPVAFTLASGALPTGTSLSGTGLVSGIVTATGTFSWTVRGTDANGIVHNLPDSCVVTE